jgi:pseudaminic acid cytidylyltransferase
VSDPKPKNIAIIPARGGSKRIPGKNIKFFSGNPIISYSIEVALKSKIFDDVMVSTDSQEIAACAESFGARIPFFRSEKNSNDYASTLDVVHEVLASYEKLGKSYDNICVIYPTAPFITIDRLKEGYEKLKTANAVVPVTEFSYPVWRSFKVTESSISYQWPEHEMSRSQDLVKLYHDAGQWYWLKNTGFIETLVPQNTVPVFLSNLEVQDIDTSADWKIAEMKYEYLQSIK